MSKNTRRLLLPLTIIFLVASLRSQVAKISVLFDCGVSMAYVSYNALSGTFNPTEGRVYVDGYYSDDKCFTDSPPWDLNIMFGTCGVNPGVNFTVIFLHDKDYFLATIDDAHTFICLRDPYDSSLHNVTGHVPAGEIIPISHEAYIPGFSVTVTMVLRRTVDRSVIGLSGQMVTLGQNVTMELHVTHNDKVRIKASHCWAAGITRNNTWKTLDLVTEGCPSLPFFSGFTADSSDNHLSATFPMFLITPRHESNRTTGFFCTVTACDMENADAKCSQSTCSGDDPGWGKRRRKRWIGNTFSADDDSYFVPSDRASVGYFVDVISERQVGFEPGTTEKESSVHKKNYLAKNGANSPRSNRFCLNPDAFSVVATVYWIVVIATIVCGCSIAYYLKRNRRRTQAQANADRTKCRCRPNSQPMSACEHSTIEERENNVDTT